MLRSTLALLDFSERYACNVRDCMRTTERVLRVEVVPYLEYAVLRVCKLVWIKWAVHLLHTYGRVTYRHIHRMAFLISLNSLQLRKWMDVEELIMSRKCSVSWLIDLVVSSKSSEFACRIRSEHIFVELQWYLHIFWIVNIEYFFSFSWWLVNIFTRIAVLSSSIIVRRELTLSGFKKIFWRNSEWNN